MAEIGIFAAALLAPNALVFGWSYVVYRALSKRSADLKSIRVVYRAFGVSAVVFVFLILLMRQLVVRDSWTWPFIAPAWVLTVFITHDMALGLAMKKKEGGVPGSRAT